MANENAVRDVRRDFKQRAFSRYRVFRDVSTTWLPKKEFESSQVLDIQEFIHVYFRTIIVPSGEIDVDIGHLAFDGDFTSSGPIQYIDQPQNVLASDPPEEIHPNTSTTEKLIVDYDHEITGTIIHSWFIPQGYTNPRAPTIPFPGVDGDPYIPTPNLDFSTAGPLPNIPVTITKPDHSVYTVPPQQTVTINPYLVEIPVSYQQGGSVNYGVYQVEFTISGYVNVLVYQGDTTYHRNNFGIGDFVSAAASIGMDSPLQRVSANQASCSATVQYSGAIFVAVEDLGVFSGARVERSRGRV